MLERLVLLKIVYNLAMYFGIVVHLFSTYNKSFYWKDHQSVHFALGFVKQIKYINTMFSNYLFFMQLVCDKFVIDFNCKYISCRILMCYVFLYHKV